MKLLKLLIIFASTYLTAKAQSPIFKWVQPVIGSQQYGSFVSNLTSNTAGDLYFIGGAYDSCKFGNMLFPDGGTYFAKYNLNGNYTCVKKIITAGDAQVDYMISDNHSNIYIAGYFNNTISFGSLPALNGPNSFIAKFDSAGNALWSTTASSNLTGLAVDTLGNLFTSGWFYGTAYFVTYGDSLHGAAGNNGYVAKYDASTGHVIWHKGVSAQGVGYGLTATCGVAADGAGGAYAGSEFGSRAFLGNFVVYGIDTSTERGNNYIARYNTNGDVLWAQVYFCGHNSQNIQSIISNGRDGCFIGGKRSVPAIFGGATLTSPVNYSWYIAHYEGGGSFRWVKDAGDINTYNLKSDKAGNFYTATTGNYNSISVGSSVIPAGQSGSNLITAKFDTSGNGLWANYMVTGNGATGANTNPFFITPDNKGGAYAAADFGGSASFGSQSYSGWQEGSRVFITRISAATSIQNAPLPSGISIFPNPATAQVTIRFAAGRYNLLTIYDALGRVVYSRPVAAAAGELRADMEQLASGIYTVQLSGAAGVANEKLVLRH